MNIFASTFAPHLSQSFHGTPLPAPLRHPQAPADQKSPERHWNGVRVASGTEGTQHLSVAARLFAIH